MSSEKTSGESHTEPNKVEGRGLQEAELHTIYKIVCSNTVDPVLFLLFKNGRYEWFSFFLNILPSGYKHSMYEARSYFYQRKFKAANKIVDTILLNKPDADAWYFKGEVLEKLRFFMPAVNAYEKAAELGIRSAETAKRRLLLNLGATSLVEEMPDNQEVIKEQIAGDKAVRMLQWQEDIKALDQLKGNISLYPGNEEFHRRRRYDTLVTLRKIRLMKETVTQASEYRKKEILPSWIENIEADALLYLRQPRKAMVIYRRLLEQLKENGSDRYPHNYHLRMAVYSCLIELEQYGEAEKVLKGLAAEIKPERIIRGIKQKDFNKVRTAVESVWLLIYQNKLNEAFDLALKLHKQAPGSRSIQLVLGSVLYFRGLPRQALELIKPLYLSTDPEEKDDSLEITYLTVLNEVGSKYEARVKAVELNRKYPRYTNVSRLLDNQAVEDSSTLRLDFSFKDYFRERLDTPLDLNHRIYQEYSWWHDGDANSSFSRSSAGTSSGSGAYRQYLTLGANGIITPDLSYDVNIRTDFKNRMRPGGGLSWQINDHWRIFGSYTGLSDDVPVIEGFYGQTFTLGGTWYLNEIFRTEIRGQYTEFSDDNSLTRFTWNSRLRLYSAAFWNFEIHKEVSHHEREFRSPVYYSPESDSVFYLIPRLEHIFHRHYERSLAHRLFAGTGLKREDRHGSGHVWFLRYEHDWTFSKRFTLLFGAAYSQNRYYGDDETDLNFYSTLIWRF